MYKNAVRYNDTMLAPGSTAFELFHSKNPDDKKKLAQHMKELDRKELQLQGLQK